MKFRHRYCCVNVGACRYAREDHIYSDEDYRRNPVCTGTQDDGCGKSLVQGHVDDPRLKWLGGGLALLVIVAVSAGLLKHFVFPDPMSGFRFEAASTHVLVGQSQVVLVIRREKGDSTSAGVHYRTEDGSAQAGRDYVASEGVLHFDYQAQTRNIELALLPGQLDALAMKSFSITLSNVVGHPRHVVVIEPPPIDLEAMSKASALVRSVSSLSMDIASFYVKRKELHRIFNTANLGVQDRVKFATELDQMDVDMAQAKKRYEDMLRSLATLDPRSVSNGFDAWDAHLDQIDMQQQRAATRISRRQYSELRQSGQVQTDRWALELSSAVPRAPSRQTPPGLGPL
jgi:hypothetical protein